VLVTARWTSPEAYDGWLQSPAREAIGAQLEPLLEGAPESRTYVIVDARGQ
jgi:quinol monooxygenase YgiN